MIDWIQAGFWFHLGRIGADVGFGLAFVLLLAIVVMIALAIAWIYDTLKWRYRQKIRVNP